MFDSPAFGSLKGHLLGINSSRRHIFGYCKSCKRCFNYTSKKKGHICSAKPLENEPVKKVPARKQNLDLSKHCGVIIGPSGVPCMRSLTCKSHSMASKRAVKNRIKDFDALLSEYMQTHPPKNIPKTVSAAVNLDFMAGNEEEASNVKLSNLNDIAPFKLKKADKIYLSTTKRNSIAKFRSIFSLLDRDRSNKISRTLCIKDKDVSLTFEDGPSIKRTKALLDLLDSLKIKGTFHVVTKHFNYAEVPKLMSEIISRGHVLGYRLEAEWTMQDISKEGIQGAVDYRLEMIKKATGKKPKFVRTSYNATELLLNSLLDSGLIITVPNFETYDYNKDFTIKSMLERFDSLSFGSVISVQREFADDLFETTRKFVDHLRDKNYNIVTLQECTGIEQIYFGEKSISPLKTFDGDLGNTESTASTATSDSYLNTKKTPMLVIAVIISILAILL